MEHGIHLILKSYFEEDDKYHEVKVGNYIADIKKGNQVIEIQTQNFKKLMDKIKYYIGEGLNVTVVYPVITERYVNWLDRNGTITERRKSPLKGCVQDVLLEVYWIHQYMDSGRLELKIILLEAEEYKMLNSDGSKYKAIKIDKVPTRIVGEIDIKSVGDLKKLVPSGLKEEFTTQEFIRATKSKKKRIGSGIKLLRELGVITLIRKEGNTKIYKRA